MESNLMSAIPTYSFSQVHLQCLDSKFLIQRNGTNMLQMYFCAFGQSTNINILNIYTASFTSYFFWGFLLLYFNILKKFIAV